MSGRYARKVDNNQAEIVDALRAAGASVQPIHTLGRGVPDLMVGIHGMTLLVEVKNGRGRMTPDEAEWQDNWRGHCAIVRTVDDALALVREAEAMCGAIEDSKDLQGVF